MAKHCAYCKVALICSTGWLSIPRASTWSQVTTVSGSGIMTTATALPLAGAAPVLLLLPYADQASRPDLL